MPLELGRNALEVGRKALELERETPEAELDAPEGERNALEVERETVKVEGQAPRVVQLPEKTPHPSPLPQGERGPEACGGIGKLTPMPTRGAPTEVTLPSPPYQVPLVR